ncbi:metalloregulator ArsR/SmtB family transcription factor [Streptomyces fagopyri]|uniref:Metalloregulator ArsR/SmtB family transcription factor n=1 Tax=Streptomyces fagopyri TaxID=2662397 RepID=A0A5Q0LPH6_9ACTN|nr:DUF5937 family protein [Streptomyces fagopyri]QFZ78419.1 metalloregulator ArsR/SmtB family transcription factor [Streptomyces fagopyri]
MSVHIDITGLKQERVAVVPSPLAELGMALHALSELDHHPGLHAWATGVTATLAPHLADQMSEADFLWRGSPSDIFMPFAGIPGRRTRPGRTIAEELDLLDRLSDEQFVDTALEFTYAASYGAPGPALLGDPVLRRRALELAASRGPRQFRFSEQLLSDPPRIRARFRQFVEECDSAFYAQMWVRLSQQLTADARRKTELLHREGLSGALSAVSPVAVLDKAGTCITVDKLDRGRTVTGDGGLLFIPTSVGWPHLGVLHRYGWQPVLHYPVRFPELASPPAVEQLASRMTALSHPLRLRLCRQLARSASTTGELAHSMDLTAPEVSRHLAVLKKAGLLTTRRRGRYVLHQLDVTVVARLGSDLLEGLLR